MTVTTPQLAATVIVARDSTRGPELFMVRRHQGSDFMAKAHVFVGGRLDGADSALQPRCGGLDSATASERLGVPDTSTAIGLYVAAIREAFEESGLLVAEQADGDLLDEVLLAEMRQRLNSGERSFGELVEQANLVLRTDRLRFLARWITPEVSRRRFDAYFFICEAPPGQRASCDQQETTAGDWFTIDALLEANTAERLQLPPPTLCTLEDLQHLRTVSELLEAAGDRPRPPRMPRAWGGSDGAVTLLLPEDHRYEDPHSEGGPEHFLVLRGKHWERMRSGQP